MAGVCADRFEMRGSRDSAPRPWLAFSAPIASAVIYYVWLRLDSAGINPCGAASLEYGYVPFAVLPIGVVAGKAIFEGKRAKAVVGLTVLATVLSALLIGIDWLGFLAKARCTE
jgi:hypothetical protein